MLSSRLLLRIILFSLAGAAVIGVTVVLGGNNVIADKMIDTLFLTALCCGVLLWVSTQVQKPQLRPALDLLAVVVTIEFILDLLLIWDVAQGSSWGEDRIGDIAFAIVPTGILAVACLRICRIPLAGIAGRVGLLLSSLTLILWLIAIAHQRNPFDFGDHWWPCGGYFLAMSLPAICALVGAGHDRWHWRWVGIGCCAGGFALLTYKEFYQISGYNEPATAVITIAILAAFANLILRAPLLSNQKWLTYASLAAAIATSCFVNWDAYEVDAGNATSWSTSDRFTAAGGILTSCGTLAVAVMMAMDRRTGAARLTSSSRIHHIVADLAHPFIIRPYQESDRGGVIDLWRETFPNAPAHNDPAADIDQKLRVQPELFFVACEGPAILGTVMSGYDGHRGWVYYVAVQAAHRRKGVGTALMRHAEQALAARGCSKLNLIVRTNNSAVVGFYQSLGYEIEERINMAKRLTAASGGA